jgi:hypothetical protein
VEKNKQTNKKQPYMFPTWECGKFHKGYFETCKSILFFTRFAPNRNFYQSLTDWGKEIYPTLATSSLPVSPECGVEKTAEKH